MTLNGKLDANLSCKIEVTPSDVKGWLKDGSALKALVNENLLDFRFTLNGVSDGGQPVKGQSRNRLFLYCRKTAVFLPGLFGSQIHFTAADGSTIGYPKFAHGLLAIHWRARVRRKRSSPHSRTLKLPC